LKQFYRKQKNSSPADAGEEFCMLKITR